MGSNKSRRSLYTAAMNYRHAFHAGNHADVLKHIALLALIDTLKRKETPFFVLDTHAGRGRYQLGGEESRKTNEADAGVMRLMAEASLPEVVERYLRAVQADNQSTARHATPGQKPTRPTAGIQLTYYPGSPLLAAQALREQDRMAFASCSPTKPRRSRPCSRGTAGCACTPATATRQSAPSCRRGLAKPRSAAGWC